MGSWAPRLRWSLAVTGSLAVYAACWAIFYYVFRMGKGDSWGLAAGPLAASVMVLGWWAGLVPTLTTITDSRLAKEAGNLAKDVLQQAKLDQGRFLDDEGEPEPANVKFGRPELVRWRSDGTRQYGSLKQIAAFYSRLRRGRLVILGKEGTGKTVLANQLIIDLIESRLVSDTPFSTAAKVPVRLSLPSFTTDGNHEAADISSRMDAWIVTELVTVFSVKPRSAKALVERSWILPVLDGLDEMDSVPKNGAGYADGHDRATHVVRALNYPVRGALRAVVVTCRIESYEQSGGEVPGRPVVQDATTVQINPLSGKQAADYIAYRFQDPAQTGQVEERWRAVVRDLRSLPPSALATELNSPLWLFMAISVYRDPASRPSELTELAGDKIRSHLLSKFIPAVTGLHSSPGGGHYDPEEVTRWLSVLAWHLDAQQRDGGSGSDLDLSRLWEAAGRRLSRYLAAVLYGALMGMSLLLTVGLYLWSVGHLRTPTAYERLAVDVCAALAVLMMWRASRRSVRISRLAPLRAPHGRRNLARGLKGAIEVPLEIAGGVVLGILGWLIVMLAARLVGRHAAGLAGGLVAALAIGLWNWWYRSGTGRQASFLTTVPVFALLVGAGLWLGIWQSMGFRDWLVLGLAVFTIGLTLGLARGLTEKPSAIRHPSELVVQGLRYDFTAGIAQWLTFALAGAIAGRLSIGLVPGVAVGMAFGFFAAASWNDDSPWPRYFAATSILARRDQLPKRLERFLDWAYHVNLMRLSGISIQFRHREMQDYLIAGSSSPSQKPVTGQRLTLLWQPTAVLLVAAGAAAMIAVAPIAVNLLPLPPLPTTGELTISQLRAGDCLRGSNLQLDSSRSFSYLVMAVPCGERHIGEVFFARHYRSHSMEYPGLGEPSRLAVPQCAKAILAYVRVDYWYQVSSHGGSLDWTSIVSDTSSGDSGGWTLDCIAYDATAQYPAGAPLYGSMRGSATPAAGSPAFSTVFIGLFHGTKPTVIDFSSDGASTVHAIHWSSWGASVATGHGTWWRDTCNPDCDTGKILKYPVTLTFSDARDGIFTALTTNWDGRIYTWHYPDTWPQQASR
jgi:NACHT domain